MNTNNYTPEQKKLELSLGIDSFDRPATKTEVQAWSQLILYLLFLRPGTYPSLPTMGIDIESYEFDFMEDVAEKLRSQILAQHNTYLSSIPLNSVRVIPKDVNGQKVLLISLTFLSGLKNVSSVIAVNTSQRRFLDYEIAW